VQRVVGGEIFVIDTEQRRSLQYAEKFRFHHVPFGAPFSPLDYLAAIEHCVKREAKTIIVDSMSHEHEGPGGVLEEHDVEAKRLAAAWHVSEEKAQMAAWAAPKKKRRQLISTIIQLGCNAIFCFRAKEKMDMKDPRNIRPRGLLPQAGEEFIYEMSVNFLLKPGADGVPSWDSEYRDEQLMTKRPLQFRDLLARPEQLSENIGEELARWAAGSAAVVAVTAEELVSKYAACSDPATLRALRDLGKVSWAHFSEEERNSVKACIAETKARMAAAEQSPETATPSARSPSQ
jgi:hypothetical protein